MRRIERASIACLVLTCASMTVAFSPRDPDAIAVLAVADLRKDKSVNFQRLDEIGHRAVKRNLKKSSYTLQFETDLGGVAEVTEDDLEYFDAEWVRQLGPRDRRYVLLLVLDDAARKRTLGSAFGTVCSGYLFDKEKGGPVWEHHATGTGGQGGLIGFAMASMTRGDSFSSCARNLMTTFPYEKKRKGART